MEFGRRGVNFILLVPLYINKVNKSAPDLNEDVRPKWIKKISVFYYNKNVYLTNDIIERTRLGPLGPWVLSAWTLA